VLIIDQEGPTRPAFVEFMRGFNQALAEVADGGYEIFIENLDLVRLGRLDGDLDQAAGWLLRKFRDAPFDVIVPTSAVTWDFVVSNREVLAPGATIVAVNRPGETVGGVLPPNSTYITTAGNVTETIELGFTLFPRARRVAVIGQTRPHPQLLQSEIDDARRTIESRGLEFLSLLDLSLEDLKERLRRLPADSIVVYIGYWKDEPGGKTYVPAVILETLCRETKAPIFGIIDTYVGRGVVGGVCTNIGALGAAAARLTAASRAGAPPDPVFVPPMVILDQRALDRFGISASRIPPGARVVFRELGFWDRYWPQAVGAGVLFVLQGLLIATLIQQLRRRQRAERLVDEQQAMIVHASRVSTLGQFAASLAHELGQPLGAMLNNIEAASLLLRDDSSHNAAELREILDDLAADDQRAGAVLDRIRAMVRKQRFTTAAVEVTSLLRDTLALAGPRLRADGIHVAVDCPAGLPPIAGDEIMLQQALLNLIGNSADAIRATRERPRGRPPVAPGGITISATLDGRIIDLAVIDTGGGLENPKIATAIEPFLTTKETGLGMGLPIVRSIVEQHDGSMQIEDDPGRGVTVRLRLPFWDEGRRE
jgi:signal transduction histidine kinase